VKSSFEDSGAEREIGSGTSSANISSANNRSASFSSSAAVFGELGRLQRRTYETPAKRNIQTPFMTFKKSNQGNIDRRPNVFRKKKIMTMCINVPSEGYVVKVFGPRHSTRRADSRR
jgi:hypothetical protein